MKNILVIEDDIILQLIYQNLLQKYDANISMCSSIMEAADCLANNHFDLIISDYNLPDSNSVVLLRLVKIWKQKTPVLIVTGNDEIRIENPGIDDMVHAVMFKPFKPVELHNYITGFLSHCA